MTNLRKFHYHEGFKIENDRFLAKDCEGTLSSGTMHPGHLIPLFMNAIKNTVEYKQSIVAPFGVPSEAWESDDHPYWFSEDSTLLLMDLMDILDNYAPEGYYFGCTEGNGSDYGFWSYEVKYQEYQVLWQINITATSARRAAEIAYKIMLDKNSSATNFVVQNKSQMTITIDVNK